MRISKKGIGYVFAALLTSLTVTLAGCSDSATDGMSENTARRARQKIADKAKNRMKLAKRDAREKVKPKRRNDGAAVSEEDYPELKPADRKTAVSLQVALDDDDFSAVKAAAKEAVRSSDPELRKQAVDALAWFGDKALPELTALLADPDGEVAAAALDAASIALSDMGDAEVQFGTAASYMEVLASNSDALDAFATSLSSSASSICEPEDDEDAAAVAKAASNRKLVVETLTRMIASGGKLAAEAKETYSFVTGNDWCGSTEAKRWARDPDGYEPPETLDE